ncbi:MAG: radical SAM protein [Bacteroidales bacterium]|nr:radical SAM protein [Bacteroidales bacterium]
MANILLTEKCVRSCPYCFAKKHMEDSDSDFLSWDNLIYIADFHEISNERHIALLGGEPTLHPNFVEFVSYLIARNFHVHVFTSGILTDEKLKEACKFLSEMSIEKLSFTCNLNHPDISTTTELDKIDKFLNTFGHLTTPGINLFALDFDISYILKAINIYNLKPHIRVGLAHPIPGEANSTISIEDLPRLAKQFLSFARDLSRLKITFGFDCGMPLCIFSDEQLGVLYKSSNGKLSFKCGPAIDIGPDMMLWSCFPLSNFHKKSIFDFNSLQEVKSFYDEIHTKIRSESGGIFENCNDCIHRDAGLCKGGCIAHLINNVNNEVPTTPKEVNL